MISDQAARVGLLFPQQRERQALICLLELFDFFICFFVCFDVYFLCFLSTKYHQRFETVLFNLDHGLLLHTGCPIC